MILKALVVAILGSDAIWPAEEETYTTVGVVWMYCPIITSLLTLAVQNAAAQNITSGTLPLFLNIMHAAPIVSGHHACCSSESLSMLTVLLVILLGCKRERSCAGF